MTRPANPAPPQDPLRGRMQLCIDPDEFAREVAFGHWYASLPRRVPLRCRRCRRRFRPRQGQPVFFSLCDACFARFDRQRMEGRAALFEGEEEPAYFESCSRWIASHPYREDEPDVHLPPRCARCGDPDWWGALGRGLPCATCLSVASGAVIDPPQNGNE